MYRYGFELEGFYFSETGLSVPPKGFPTDGFPGLVELRTHGDHSLNDAYWKIFDEYVKYPELVYRCFNLTEAVFTPEQKRQIRKLPGYHKPEADIQNIYGKKPKALGNKTIASLQINISNKTRDSYSVITDGCIVNRPATFGLLDVGRIVKALDEEFKPEIKLSGRQAGEYCIKGDRLEYRSLPNSVFAFSINESKRFLDRIRKAIEG
jgi:hypothetical protein